MAELVGGRLAASMFFSMVELARRSQLVEPRRVTSSELERVTADLSSIREAMRLGKPYTRDDVNRDLVTALCGLLAVVLILFSPLHSKLAFTLGLLPGVLYYFRFTAQQRSRRAANPSPWREEKQVLQALAIAVPLIVVWLLWSGLGSSSEGATWSTTATPA